MSNLKRHFNACSVTSSPVRDEGRRSVNKQGERCIAAYTVSARQQRCAVGSSLWPDLFGPAFFIPTPKKGSSFISGWCQKMMSAWLIGTFQAFLMISASHALKWWFHLTTWHRFPKTYSCQTGTFLLLSGSDWIFPKGSSQHGANKHLAPLKKNLRWGPFLPGNYCSV